MDVTVQPGDVLNLNGRRLRVVDAVPVNDARTFSLGPHFKGPVVAELVLTPVRGSAKQRWELTSRAFLRRKDANAVSWHRSSDQIPDWWGAGEVWWVE